MAVQFFAPKTLGSLTIGAGALTGGGAIYWYQMPRTWKELLVKEGFLFLSTEDDYKGMFHDQKESDDWKSETDLNTSQENNVETNAKKYCGKLDQTLPSSYDSNYASTKKKLISFCTFDGIQTVKGKLIQNKKNNWLGSTDTDKYKTIFAVYRYNTDFINWLKEVDPSNNVDLSKTSTVDTGYTKLQSACDNLLKTEHKKVTNDNYFKYGSWWCVDPGYKTIKDKIKKKDADWAEKEQSDSDWSSLVNTWKDTDQVKKLISKIDSSKKESDPLTEDSLKNLCSSTHVEAQLSDEDSYQEKYVVIKSVCKKAK